MNLEPITLNSFEMKQLMRAIEKCQAEKPNGNIYIHIGYEKNKKHESELQLLKRILIDEHPDTWGAIKKHEKITRS